MKCLELIFLKISGNHFNRLYGISPTKVNRKMFLLLFCMKIKSYLHLLNVLSLVYLRIRYFPVITFIPAQNYNTYHISIVTHKGTKHLQMTCYSIFEIDYVNDGRLWIRLSPRSSSILFNYHYFKAVNKLVRHNVLLYDFSSGRSSSCISKEST